MGYFTDSYKTMLAEFDAAFSKQREVITRSTDAAERQSRANQAIAASRGGYSGSDLESTLFSRNKALFTGQKNAALASLAANQESQRAGLKQQAIQGGFQEKTAEQNFFGNLLSGAGGLIGTAMKIFGGPPGIAAGTGIDVLMGMGRDTLSNMGEAAMGYKIPEFKVQPIEGLY